MSKQRYFLFLILCVGFFTNAKATHNRAGEITYKWLFGYTYQVKVSIYTEIGGTNFSDRCEDTVYFGDGTGAIVLRSNGPCNGSCSPNGCEGQPINSTTKLNEYVTTHTYPGPGNYLISTMDPNRTNGIINIPNSVNQIFYIESLLVIPTFGSAKNTSVVFGFPPLDFGCINQCFYHNSSPFDLDGDSISFELTGCRGNSGVCPGYTFPSSGTGGVFVIDSITGILTWCNPQMQGDYNVATLIKEWRKDDNGNYSLIGYILRDAQFAISYCSGIYELNQFNDFVTVLPNPVTETITLNFHSNNHEAFRIELMDITGRNIKTLTSEEYITKENTIHLNLENINPGIYLLKISGNQHTTITKKIIKQ
ncbi:MAG: T9SS type A sorting domain-containing protein [Burkholderiales bacterium]|nr:T9SS type A sorting domain-containing protein [Bacteroidia bacterium]